METNRKAAGLRIKNINRHTENVIGIVALSLGECGYGLVAIIITNILDIFYDFNN